MSNQTTATVETLTAEVRVLMVGNRQVTKGVYLQLDYVRPPLITPFGRVNTGLRIDVVRPWVDWTEKEEAAVEVVGRDVESGELVRSYLHQNHSRHQPKDMSPETWKALKERWVCLPLIVLAGLR